MTEKEKQLLLGDISARYMNGLMCVVEGHEGVYQIVGTYRREGYGAAYAYIDVPPFGDIIIDIVKSYLRPMSSMTEEERKTYGGFIYTKHHDWDGHSKSTNYVEETDVTDCIDWLNSHHFDYRGLIEKGLALEAPEGMYNLN